MPSEQMTSEEARSEFETRPEREELEYEAPPEDELPFHIPRD